MTLDYATPGLPKNTLRRDVISAYAASGSRVLSWVIVSALVYRRMGEGAFAMLALVRATVGILNYVGLGLGPALVHRMAQFTAAKPVLPIPPEGQVLEYATPRDAENLGTPLQRVYWTGFSVAMLLVVVGSVISTGLSLQFGRWFEITPGLKEPMPRVVIGMCVAVLFRLWSDPSGAVLQTHQRIWIDNLLLAGTEIAWAIACLLLVTNDDRDLARVTWAAAFMSVALMALRFYFASKVLPLSRNVRSDYSAAWQVLSFGVLITLSQVAEFLYAPIDFILINKLISAEAVAVYAPAVQIDAGLFLLVGGLAAVLLPKAALAHAGGDRIVLRQYYVRGTLASAGLLLIASLAVWILSPWIFKLWLGSDVPATRAILPLILLHTVVGGSSAVGRSIFLGMGRVKAYTTAVLIAGIMNVVLSYCFVTFFEMGLYGIVWGTIAVVVLRCAVWMPWYVLREIRRNPVPAPPPEPPVPVVP